MISVDEALACYRDIQPLPATAMALEGALGLIAAAPVQAPVDLPLGDQSALDGYALRSADTARACVSTPIRMPLNGEQAAGLQNRSPLPAGHCRRIFTGAWMPAGCDAMVAQERVSVSAGGIRVSAPVSAGENVRRRGEEIRAGALLLDQGALITPGVIAMLAMAGVGEIQARPRPRVGLIVTGNELVAAGQPLQAGQAFDANGPALRSLLRSWGCQSVRSARAPDSLAETTAILADLDQESDLIVTTGGVSVGDHDHIRAAAKSCGYQEVFWRVAQKPGKPMLLARHGNRWLLGLPGNPAAVYLCAHLHLAPIVRQLSGLMDAATWRTVRTQLPIAADSQRERLVRVQLAADPAPGVRPLSAQASHMLSNLRHAAGMVRIPAGKASIPVGAELAYLDFATNISFPIKS